MYDFAVTNAPVPFPSVFRTKLFIGPILAALVLFTLPAIAASENGASPKTPAYMKQLSATAKAAKPVPVKVEQTAVQPPSAIPSVAAGDLADSTLTIDDSPASDAAEIAPIKLSLDKPEVIRLDRDAINVIVGSNENLRVVPDTNRSLLLIAKKPGSTYFQALDADGRIIMQRHVLIGSPSSKYVRIRRACANGADGCRQYSVYYCPDMCHEVNVAQGTSGTDSAIPEETPAASAANGTATPSPAPVELPPGE